MRGGEEKLEEAGGTEWRRDHGLPRRPDRDRRQGSVRVERGGAQTKDEQGAQLQREAAPAWEPDRE